MSEWKEVCISECADILDSLRIPVSGEVRSAEPGATPYYGANGLQGYIAGYLFDEPLILIAEDGGYFDEFANRPIAYRIAGKSWVNNHAHILRPKPGFDFDFLFYSLEHKNIVAFIKGGTRAKLNQAELRDIRVVAPPLVAMQKKIAAILTSIDTAIEKTEALIAKYQQIKLGLMHDLFTRGVLPNGQLRPPREQAPELYQETNEGEIPKDWERKTLGAACTWSSGGTPSKSNESFWNGALPWLSPKDMKQFELGDTQDHVTRQAAFFGSRIAPAGTVFIVVRGMILAHSFPVVLSTAEFSFNQDVKAVVACQPLSNRYLAYWFVAYTNLFLKKTTESTHGTKRFDLNDLYKIAIGVPTADEQQRIIERLDTIERRVANEAGQRNKLQTQKLGLMQDLLTGKVAVKVDTAEKEFA